MGNTFAGTVSAVANQGFAYEVQVKTGDLILKSLVTKKSLVDMELREGLDVSISFYPSAVHTF